MSYVEVLILLAVAAFLFYKWATAGFGIFDERGVPYKKPWPLFGNTATIMLGTENLQKLMIRVYLESKMHKIFGFFNFRESVFIVNDRDLIKKITVKDFEYFPNHVPIMNDYDDPLMANMITIMKDQRWKDMRNTLTPAFTGAKMRSMFYMINECCMESINYLKGLSAGKEAIDIDLMGHLTRFSNDVIASTAFGLSVNSNTDRDNEFYRVGRDLTSFNLIRIIGFFMYKVSPKLMKMLRFNMANDQQANYLIRLVKDTMKNREENGIIRPDMIHLLMEANKEKENSIKKMQQPWTDEEIVAQCFLFFFAGFINNASFICTICFELMANPDIQERLLQEIIATADVADDEAFGYDSLMKMEYMDMVASETLRKWSLAAFGDRLCAKDYTLRDDDGNEIMKFFAGDRVWFPISGLHYDEENFPEPHIFDPERFSAANKEKIKPFSYLPFGIGPRNCIANRYALMVAKTMIFHLVLAYKIERAAKTVKDLANAGKGFQIVPSKGFWIKLVPR